MILVLNCIIGRFAAHLHSSMTAQYRGNAKSTSFVLRNVSQDLSCVTREATRTGHSEMRAFSNLHKRWWLSFSPGHYWSFFPVLLSPEC